MNEDYDEIDLSDPKQRRRAEELAADQIFSEITPHLFYDADREAWASLLIGDHLETYAVESAEMREILDRAFWEEMKRLYGVGKPMPKKLLDERIGILKRTARYDGKKETVSLRVGEHSGIHYIDLCDDRWRCIRVDSTGWEIVEDKPQVFFRRTLTMEPLPIPVRGGSVDELQRFLNDTEDEFTLVKSWLLAALRSIGPYPLMILIGPQGAAKSSFAKIIRKLTDPSSMPTIGRPRNVRDLHAVAQGSHVLGFDNISKLKQEISDGLCRISSGAAHEERRLNTNKEVVRFPFVARPMIMNGIPEFIEAPDLLDRSIILRLRFIENRNRKTEKDLWRDFDKVSPRIFGGLLDLMVNGVRNLPTTQVAYSSRMADFITWVTACGLPNFEKCYENSRIDNSQALLEHDKLAIGLNALMEKQAQSWKGNAENLILALQAINHPPKTENPREIAEHLRKIAPTLRIGFGINVEFLQRKNNMRPVRISRP